MKRTRKGFTIVELVIVIAVIAILAAVLIPTFSNLIEKASVSNDTAVVRNINLLLAADEAENGVIDNDYDKYQNVISVAEAGGYVIERLTPMSTGEIIYDKASNRILLVNGENIVYKDAATTITDLSNKSVLLKVCNTEDDESSDYGYMYKKVSTPASLTGTFVSAQAGIVLDSDNIIALNADNLADTTINVSDNSMFSNDTIENGKLKLLYDENYSSLDRSFFDIYVARNKVFRVSEGTTVTIATGTKILHDGKIILCGTLDLSELDGINTYVHSLDQLPSDEQFFIKSTGKLILMSNLDEGTRDAIISYIKAEEGAQIVEKSSNKTWIYSGNNWDLAG